MSRRIKSLILGLILWVDASGNLRAQVTAPPVFSEFQVRPRATGTRHFTKAGEFGCRGFASGSTMNLSSLDGKPASNETQGQINKLLKAFGVEEPILAYSSEEPSLKDNIAIAFQDADHNHHWVIVYSPASLQSLNTRTRNSWAIMSVFAHEIGHHVNAHTSRDAGSSPDREKQADYFSGHIMKVLGADLDDAQGAVKSLEKESDASTHPAKLLRLAEIKRGFDNASAPKVVVQEAPKNPGGVTPGGGLRIPSPAPVASKPPQTTTQPLPSPPSAPAQPEMIWVACLHYMPCQHIGPCIDGGVPCFHAVNCTHTVAETTAVACSHVLSCIHFGTFGEALHPYDTHSYDTITSYAQIHTWDPLHSYNHPHEVGDLLHYWGDPQHPEGHMIPSFYDASSRLGFASGPKPLISWDTLSIAR